MNIERQVVVIYAATKGYLDKMKVSDIGSFEQTILKEVDPKVLETIGKEKAISDSLNKELTQFFNNITDKFLATR